MGSVDYYTNCFKSVVLNNMVSEKSVELEEIYAHLINEIDVVCIDKDEKNLFLHNLDRAYKSLHRDLVEVEVMV